MARPVSVEVVMDDTSYLRGAGNVVSTNTKLGASYTAVAERAKASADAQVGAALKAQEAMRANIAGLQGVAARGGSGGQTAAVLAAREQAKLDRSLGLTTASTERFSKSTKTAENDLNKMSRGVLAGTGILGGYAKSLAFASSGFIAFSVGAKVITDGISDAENLAKAQESLSVAIEHTGGSVKQLLPKYQAIAKAAADFGISEQDATAGLARATVLTGNATKAQRAYQEALVISKATGKDFNQVLIATSKGQEGETASLHRYGILVATTSTGTQQFTAVMKRFGGQAKANTTASDKLKAALTNANTAIGQALLPTFDKLATKFSTWLDQMNRSGKLQKDVAAGMKDIKAVASPLTSSLKELAGAIGLVNKGWKHLSDLTSGHGLVASNLSNLFKSIKLGISGTLFPLNSLLGAFGNHGAPGVVTSSTRHLGGAPGFFGDITSPQRSPPATGPFGTAKPDFGVFSKFALPLPLQIAQARAALTKTVNDDVTVAKKIIAYINKLKEEGRLKGAVLLAALQEEGSALAVVQSAQQQAAQTAQAAAAKARQAAAKAKAREQARLNNLIDPLKLEVALSKAQAQGKSIVPILKALRASAYKALASGKLSLQQQKQAWDQIAQLNQQITDALKKSTSAASGFKQANTKALTSGLGLDEAQRKALRARLSQLGPHGTVPGPGVGGAGYAIGDNGRPIHIHTHVHVKDREIGNSVTRYQQKRRRRNSTQRRGPNAGLAAA